MDALAGTISNSGNHQTMMNAYNKIGYMLAVQQQQGPSLEKMAGNVERFEQTMDEMLIGNNVANNLLFKNDNNVNADYMLNALKGEIALEQDIKMKQVEVAQNPYMNAYTNKPQQNLYKN